MKQIKFEIPVAANAEYISYSDNFEREDIDFEEETDHQQYVFHLAEKGIRVPQEDWRNNQNGRENKKIL